jgi:hypothetical protein
MTLRKGHGTGAGAPRIEVMPADELPPASPNPTAPSNRGPDGRFLRGNTAQRDKLVRPGVRGFTSALAVHEDFAPFQRWGQRYASHRRTELATAHGGKLSAGVSALIESAGAQLAASRFVQAKASATGDADGFKRASALANDARQNELAAWELAAREGKAREESDDRKPDPWERGE